MARTPAYRIDDFGLMPTSRGWQAYWYVGDWGKSKRQTCSLGLEASVSRSRAIAHFMVWVRATQAAQRQNQKYTVGQIMDRYIEDRRREGKRADKMVHQWKPMREHFQHLHPADLDVRVKVAGHKEPLTPCHTYAVAREANGLARETIHSELNLLRSAMAWAANRLGVEKVHVWVSRGGARRKTALDSDQVIRLLGAIIESPPHIRLLMLIAFATGARKEAILELTWDRVNFGTGQIDFNTNRARSILDTSHQKGRAVVDMGAELTKALAEAKAVAKTAYVIERAGRPIRDPKEGVSAVFRRAGLTGRYMGLHALRHTLATAAAQAGIDSKRIQEMLGHASLQTTEQVYIELRPGHLSEVARVADTKFAEFNKDKSQMRLVEAQSQQPEPSQSSEKDQ